METGHPSTRAVNSASGNRALVFVCTSSDRMDGDERLTHAAKCSTHRAPGWHAYV